MNNKVEVFNHEQFGEVKTILHEDGSIWFDGNQVAKALGYVKERNAITRHCKGALKHSTIKNKGGYPLTIIPEADLYRLIIGSHLPGAEKFEEWVFEEVLPSIRKHGAYMTENTIEELIQSPDMIIELATTLKEEREKRSQAEKTIAVQKPKVEYFEKVLNTQGSMTATQAAKALGLKSAIQLNNMLHELGIQYKQSGQWHLYSKYAGKGYTETATHIYEDDKGYERASKATKWTEKGLNFIYKELKKHGLI